MKTKHYLQILAVVTLVLAAFTARAGETTYYIYDEAGHVIGEYDQNGNPIQEHIYLGNRPVAVVTNGQVDNVTTDQLDTPRAITDSSQAVVWNWSSDPFGNGQPTGSLTYNLRFPGQYYDAETGHNYNYDRDYDPSTGRYIEPDPIGVAGIKKEAEDLSNAYWLFTTGEHKDHAPLIEYPGLDLYLYTDQNPVTRYDRKGDNWVVIVGAAIIFAAAYGISLYVEEQCQKKCIDPKVCPYKLDSGDPIEEQNARAWIYGCKARCAKGIGEALKALGEAN